MCVCRIKIKIKKYHIFQFSFLINSNNFYHKILQVVEPCPSYCFAHIFSFYNILNVNINFHFHSFPKKNSRFREAIKPPNITHSSKLKFISRNLDVIKIHSKNINFFIYLPLFCKCQNKMQAVSKSLYVFSTQFFYLF